MKWKRFGSLILCTILALSLVIVGSIKGSNILFAFTLAVIAVGLGANSFIIALKTDEKMHGKMNSIDSTLAQIAGTQEEIKKALEEQPSSGKSIVETLQAFSQLYMDYLAKKQSDEETQRGKNETDRIS